MPLVFTTFHISPKVYDQDFLFQLSFVQFYKSLKLSSSITYSNLDASRSLISDSPSPRFLLIAEKYLIDAEHNASKPLSRAVPYSGILFLNYFS